MTGEMSGYSKLNLNVHSVVLPNDEKERERRKREGRGREERVKLMGREGGKR